MIYITFGALEWSRSNKKKFLDFFLLEKKNPFFLPHPPAFPPEPLKGGLCHAPAKSGFFGKSRKKGQGVGVKKTRQFRRKRGQNRAKMGVFGGFRRPKVTFFCKFQKKWVFFTSIAPRKKSFKASCPLCKNPPIYTVLNAAFSAPHPPLRGYQCTRVPSRGVFGGPPQNPLPSRRPPCTPPAPFNMLPLQMCLHWINYIVNKLKLYNICYKHSDCLDRKSTYI